MAGFVHRASAVADARNALGHDAIEDADFRVFNNSLGKWAWIRLWPKLTAKEAADDDEQT